MLSSSRNCLGLFLLSILLLNGCSKNVTGNALYRIPQETNLYPEVYFCPGDDCSKIFEKMIMSANNSVNCALYDINLNNIISALSRKSRTLDVKIVIDNSNYKGQIKGDAVKLDMDNHLMHNKFCVIDGATVMTGSFNPTDNDNYNNNNNLVVAYSNVLARNYEDEFNELWNGKFGTGNKVKYPVFYVNDIKIESYFCPEDGCASRVIELIENAKKSVYFMAFAFTNERIADSLITKNNMDIRGIFDSSQSSNKFSQYKRLKEFGLNVEKDNNKYKMHHKVFIIDNETVATGSFNPTSGGDEQNDENLLIIHDKKIAKRFLAEFDSLWH